MRSPLRPIPSLGGRRRRPAPADMLLAVPRVSPERELAVLRALMKPQAGQALIHQIDEGLQPWPTKSAARAAGAVAAAARHHFGWHPDLLLPPAGEYHLIARSPPESAPAAMATALLLSRAFPGVWVVAGRLFVRDETFHRRERGVKLKLRVAGDVHLSRVLRAAYREAAREVGEGERILKEEV